MNQKKVFLLFISLLIISLFSNVVFAQGGLGSIADTIYDLVGFIPDLVTLENLIDEEPAAVFWAKFLIWILLFAAFYFGATKIPGLQDNKRITMVLAIVLSIISTVMIPNEIIFNIFQTYGLVAGIALFVIPLAAVMVINNKLGDEHRWVKVIVLLIALMILVNINTTLRKVPGVNPEWFDYFPIFLAIVTIMLIWNLIQAFSGGTAGNKASNLGSDLWGGLTGGKDDSGEGDEKKEKQEAYEKAVEEAKDLNEKLQDIERRLREELENSEVNEIRTLEVLAQLIKELGEVREELKRARG